MYIYLKKSLANTFHKYERLCSKKHIDQLFENGESFSAYPLKLVYQAYKSESQDVKAMFVAPKKKFKHANDRNTLKRRMREAYRLQKADFYKVPGISGLDLAFIYYANKPEEYQVIFKALSKLLNNLSSKITGAVK